ncbi:MAG TPA: hypothetical protein ENI23_04210 [bacterium]|nr:hypothetical protein [bacterium]
MKLKTVEDLVLWLRDYDLDKVIEKAKNNKGSDCVVRLEDLKDLAIKWVKNEKEYHNKFRDARANVLMEFHNITEEDLK